MPLGDDPLTPGTSFARSAEAVPPGLSPSFSLDLANVKAWIDQAGARISLRRRQILDLDPPGANDRLYVVKSGVVAVVTRFGEGRRQILAFRSAGRLLWPLSGSRAPGLAIEAIIPSQLLRFQRGAVDAAGPAGPAIAASLHAALEIELERISIHTAMVGRLKAEERVATFLFEQALCSGRWHGDAVTIPVPMSRNDIADYVGLNPDNLSRLLSQMRRQKLVSLTGRASVHVPRWRDLAAATPLAGALTATYGEPGRE